MLFGKEKLTCKRSKLSLSVAQRSKSLSLPSPQQVTKKWPHKSQNRATIKIFKV